MRTRPDSGPSTQVAPRLSVVLASTEPWPEVRGCLESLTDQARAVDAEVILADSDGRALPDDHDFSDIIWLKKPGASVFQLRALGLARARADVVAVTEDHCEVGPGWCERTLEAHRAHPTAAAIGGVVENGATGSLIDWINFLIANGPFMAPLETGETRAICGQANVTYKRSALPSEFGELGLMEMLFNRELARRGEKLVSDAGLVVAHVQSLGFRGTCRTHFHNGRSIAGFRLRDLSPVMRLLRLGGCFILPAYLPWRTIRAVLTKRRLVGKAVVGLPIMVMLSCCHAAGEFLGYLAGSGRSPQQSH